MALVSGIQYSTEITSRKNFIINGNFDIWQRGTSFPAAAFAEYTADRFYYVVAGAAVHTVSRSTDVPTRAESGIKSNYSLLIDCTTADTSIATGDLTVLAYRVEGYDYAQLAGGNATLSFWVKGTKTGTHCVAFQNSGGDRSYVYEYTINVTDTWEKKIITVPLTETGGTWDYTDGIGLVISFTLSSGATFQTTADAWQTGNYVATSNQVNACDSTSNNFQLAQVQFEKGTVATDFEQRHIADELAMCQRYYERIENTSSSTYVRYGAGFISSATSSFFVINFAVAKRGVPAAAVSAASDFSAMTQGSTDIAATVLSFVQPSETTIGVNVTHASGGTAGEGAILRAPLTSTAWVEFDAEL